jgi:hypothetical protein
LKREIDLFVNYMERKIVDFIKDEEGFWTAILACGHKQHVRHNPPWQIRPWTQTQKGRKKFIGFPLFCKKCERSED